MSNNKTGNGTSPGGGLATFSAKKVKKGSPIVNITVILIAAVAIIVFFSIVLRNAEKSAAMDITSDLSITLNYGDSTTFWIQPGHKLKTNYQIYTDQYWFHTDEDGYLDVVDDRNSKLVLMGNIWVGNKRPAQNTAYLVYTNNTKKKLPLTVKRTRANETAQLIHN